MSLGDLGKICIGWFIVTTAGISGFILAKNSVEKQRYESMQVRERMRKSNIGEYEVTTSRRFTG